MPITSPSPAALALVVAVAWTCVGAQDAWPPTGYTPISTKSCTNDAPQNVMPTLPRLDRRGRAIPSDMGAYRVVNCTVTGTSTSSLSCTVPATDLFKGDGLKQVSSADGVPGSVVQYAEGVLMYGALAIALAVLAPLTFILFCIGRYCCCCCSRTNCCCVCIQCGAHEPTKRMCCCGVVPVEEGDGAAAAIKARLGHSSEDESGAPHATPATRYEYPRLERILTFVLLVVFVGFILGMIGVGANLGFQAIPAAASDVAPTLTSAIMPLVNSVVTKVSALGVTMGSTVLAPQMLIMNSTVQSGINLGNVHGGLSCIVNRIDTLPDVAAVTAFSNAMNASLTEVKAGVNGLVGEVNGVIAGKDNVSSAVATLSGSVASLSTSLTTLSTALTQVNTTLTPLINVQGTLLNNSGALVPSLRSDLSLLQPNVGIPNATFLATTSGPANIDDISGVGTMNRLIKTTMNNDPAEQALLASRLAIINASIAGVLGPVNFSRTADTLLAINDLAHVTRTVYISDLSAAMASAQAAVAALPTSSSLLPAVDRIDTSVRAITFGGIMNQLYNMRDVLGRIPNITELVVLIDSVRGAADIVPCAQQIVDELRRANSTLLRLPSSLNDVLRVLDDANSTVNNAIAQIDTAKAELNSAQNQINSVNITTYIVQAQDAWGSANSSLAAFNVTDVRARVQQLDTAIPVNFTQLRSTLESLNTTLAGFTLNTTLATTLRTFEADKRGFIANMSTVLTDLRSMVKGYCTTAVSTACDVDGDCGANGPCINKGLYRCRNAPGTPCLQDSQCGVGDTCLMDVARAIGVKSGLDVVAGQAPNVSASLSTLDTIASSTNSVDTVSMRANLNTAKAAIATVDTAAIQAELTTVNSSLASLDTASIQSTLNSLQSSITNVNFNQFTPQLNSLNDTVNQIKVDARNQASNVLTLVETTQRILNNDLSGYVARLSASALNDVVATQGLGGLATAVGGIAEDVLNTVRPNVSSWINLPTFNVSSLLPIDNINKYSGTGPYASNRQQGLIYYALSLVMGDRVLPANTANTRTIFDDAAGTRYSDNKLCVTDACISATASQYTSQTLAQISTGIVPLNITPLALLNLVWLFPSFVVLFGLFGMFSRFMCRRPAWQKCPLGCMTGCIMIQVPACFLLAAFTFPLAMFLGDACASGRNIGYATVLANGEGLCRMVQGTPVAGTSGPTFACSLSTSVSLPSGDSAGLSTSVAFASYYKVLVGDGQCPATDPWAPVFADVARQLRIIPFTQTRYFLTSSSGPLADTGVTLLPTLTDAVYGAVNATGNALADWTTDFATTVLSCPSINSALLQTMGVACCTLYRPIYYIATVFYLIAWAYCLCGLPAGLLGRKRLPTGPWGTLDATAAKPATRSAAKSAEGVWGSPSAQARHRDMDPDVAARLNPVPNDAEMNEASSAVAAAAALVSSDVSVPALVSPNVNARRGAEATAPPLDASAVYDAVLDDKRRSPAASFPPQRAPGMGLPTTAVAYPPMMGQTDSGAAFHQLPPPSMTSPYFLPQMRPGSRPLPAMPHPHHHFPSTSPHMVEMTHYSNPIHGPTMPTSPGSVTTPPSLPRTPGSTTAGAGSSSNNNNGTLDMDNPIAKSLGNA